MTSTQTTALVRDGVGCLARAGMGAAWLGTRDAPSMANLAKSGETGVFAEGISGENGESPLGLAFRHPFRSHDSPRWRKLNSGLIAKSQPSDRCFQESRLGQLIDGIAPSGTADIQFLLGDVPDLADGPHGRTGAVSLPCFQG